MPARHYISPTVHKQDITTVNLGTKAAPFKAEEIGKAVKLSGADTYVLCAAGDKIEGIVTSSELAATGATRGGMSVGGIQQSGHIEVVSAAALVAGDYVVAAAQPAVGTPLTSIGEGQTPCTPVQKVADQATVNGLYAMRIVGLGPVGTGAAGTVCVAKFL